MQCEHCEYLLFNLTRPVCPECGQPFDIGRYRFEEGAVSFNCPHCDQDYYGNDAQGLPYPREFDCVTCSRHISLNEMRVVPLTADAMGVRADQSPWDRRRSLGFLPAWWETFKMTLVRPSQLFREHSGTSIKEAWLFAMTTSYIGMLPYVAFHLLMVVAMGAIVGGTAGGGVPSLMPFLLLYGFMALIFPPLGALVAAAIQACFIQLGLLLVAPQRKPWDYTFRTCMYASGPNALLAIPFCGAYVGGVWAVVTTIIGIREVHKTTGWRAAVAVLWPIVLLLGLYILGVVVFIMGTSVW
jgi:hypothetical protein